ncbi:MAG: P-loop NTPase fold protein, partial [Rhodobacterales bacterium]|nr:P-loop NTPase fold protein [Rhodobacterales bacterium]
EKLWEKEDGQRAAMKEFEEGLIAMTYPDGEGNKPRKIVIVIDELDRCRPDYALSLLEVIKHFFAVPHVHFVLGVNLAELQNSVRARYGAGIDAAKYLQKFVQVTLKMNAGESQTGIVNAGARYFDYLRRQPEYKGVLTGEILRYLERMAFSNQISLREAERLISLTILCPYKGMHDNDLERFALAGLLILSVSRPDWIARIRQEGLSAEAPLNYFGFDVRSKSHSDHWERTAYWIWTLALDRSAEIPREDRQAIPKGLNIERSMRVKILNGFCERNLDMFTLVGLG